MSDFIQLHAHWPGKPTVTVHEGHTTMLGRGKWSLTSSAISRAHCELYWKGLPEIRVSAIKKPVWLAHAGEAQHEQIDTGESGVVRHSLRCVNRHAQNSAYVCAIATKRCAALTCGHRGTRLLSVWMRLSP